MAVATQQELALQMLAQLRRLDSSVSAEVGTPERKLIDTVAQALSDAQVDLNALQVGLDIDGKFGDELDRFLALFGFGRQSATFSTGFITFSRTVASTVDITIPSNTAVRVPFSDLGDFSGGTVFYTTASVTLSAGTTDIVAPIRAAVAGSGGNVAVNTITEMIGSPILGITGITNEVATRGGISAESDDEYKVRFRNTVFRNLAGTRDQYLALAVSTQYSLKANVIGPQSLWTEYMQVPAFDDATPYDINDDSTAEAGGGLAGEFSSALSSLPFAKAIWTNLPAYVSNGVVGPGSYFYRPDVDFRFNTTSLATNKGDALRLFTGYGTLAPNPLTSTNRPSITFTNVYTGNDTTVQVVRPNDTVLVEFSYLSDASRNDLSRNVTNCVDVYVDGGNNELATTVLTAPTAASIFIDDPTSKFHYENYRRDGEPTKRPLLGNFLMPLYWQPVTSLPSQIIVGDNTYQLGTHYWLVKDVSEVGGSWRARSGIEWSATVKGSSATTARLISNWIGPNFSPITIEDYSFDRNIVDLQAALEGSRQITADVLAHKAYSRFFKFDITVMYTRGVNATEVNLAIRDAVDRFLKSQYFGSVIQLSDVLDVIHTVSGVDNVRWSSDLPNNEDLARAYECDVNGKPLLTMSADHFVLGDGSTIEKQQLFLTGSPLPYVWSFDGVSGASTQLSSYLAFSFNGNVSSGTALISSGNLASSIQTQLRTITGLTGVTVAENNRSTLNVKNPIRSFTVTWDAVGTQPLILPIPHLKGGPTVIFNDFVLRDNELAALPTGTSTGTFYTSNDGVLPADSAPGFIIRTRAQNTFLRS
jgi:uncharacterized phage protein gp47/JayE